METNSPADEPTPAIPPAPPVENILIEPPAEAPVEAAQTADFPEPTPAKTADTAPEETPADATDAPDELTQLAEASQKARLSQADEDRMATLLKEALLGGRGGVARAIVVLPKVPWIVGVRAVEAVWPELTAGFRTQLLAGLAKEETDAARRIRLSLARALFKLDLPVALKVASAVARELPDKETGVLSAKQAQIFANVFIGRGKPWLAQLPLADLKPADIDALVHSAVVAVFTVPHPPVTQLGVVKWVREQERLDKLEPAALEALKKGIARWGAKWQAALRKEVADLPEQIAEVLKPITEDAGNGDSGAEAPTVSEDGTPTESADPNSAVDDEDDEDEDEEVERKERPVYEPRPQKPAAERPVYTPRNAGGNVPRNFNLNESLRNIESYVNSLRNDLAAAKTRQKDDRRHPEKSVGPVIEGEPTVEELARLNLQLEARNAELQERIKDLTQHSEDLATSTGAMAGQPVEDTGTQLRTLLGLKLQEDFADFLALEKEGNDIVIQQHYRGLIRHVFEVLQQLEVPLKPAE
jgi:hypothetical protein